MSGNEQAVHACAVKAHLLRALPSFPPFPCLACGVGSAAPAPPSALASGFFSHTSGCRLRCGQGGTVSTRLTTTPAPKIFIISLNELGRRAAA